MFPKKQLHKRRIRNLIPKVLFLCFLFFLTSGILFGWYFIQKGQKKTFVSPIVTTITKKQAAVSPNATPAIEDLLKRNNFIPISIATASDAAIFVTLDNGEHIIFSENKDINEQITSLQLIQRQLTIEGKRVNQIDFRFDNPVLSF